MQPINRKPHPLLKTIKNEQIELKQRNDGLLHNINDFLLHSTNKPIELALSIESDLRKFKNTALSLEKHLREAITLYYNQKVGIDLRSSFIYQAPKTDANQGSADDSEIDFEDSVTNCDLFVRSICPEGKSLVSKRGINLEDSEIDPDVFVEALCSEDSSLVKGYEQSLSVDQKIDRIKSRVFTMTQIVNRYVGPTLSK